MPLDIIQAAALFSGLGAALGQGAALVVQRLNSKDTKTVTLTTHMSEQSKLLFDQMAATIKDVSGTAKDLTTERNNLQLQVFELVPDATKMRDFEKELHSLGLTFEDANIIIREQFEDNGSNKPRRRWTDGMKYRQPKPLSGDTPVPLGPPGKDTG